MSCLLCNDNIHVCVLVHRTTGFDCVMNVCEVISGDDLCSFHIFLIFVYLSQMLGFKQEWYLMRQ